jgi:hypothetical protein
MVNTEKGNDVPLTLGPWTLNSDNQYFLHVTHDGREIGEQHERKRESLRVTVVAVGDGFVDETTRVFTFEREDRGALYFDTIAPRGRGWERDADADAHADKWTAWRRRRTWRIE